MLKAFGEEPANDSLRILRDLLKQDIPVQEVCVQIQANLDYSSRLQLLHLLFGIANADGELHKSELALIDSIAHYLKISYLIY